SRTQFNRPYLRYRGKKTLGWIPCSNQILKFDGDTAVFQKKRYRLWLHRPLGGRILSGSFSCDTQGRWYVNFVCEVSEQPKAVKTNSVIGIDLGIKTV